MKWLKRGALAFVFLIALSVVILLALGARSGAGETTVRVKVRRPAAVVWAWLNDADKFSQWVSWVTEVKDEGPRRRISMRDPNMDNQVVIVHSVVSESRPPAHLRVEVTSPVGFSGHVVYDLTEASGETEIVQFSRFSYTDRFAQLLEPLVTPQVRAKNELDLATLKRLAEK